MCTYIGQKGMLRSNNRPLKSLTCQNGNMQSYVTPLTRLVVSVVTNWLTTYIHYVMINIYILVFLKSLKYYLHIATYLKKTRLPHKTN